MTDTTYFGLPIVAVDGSKFVRVSDIQKLPFFEFWQESAVGSAMRVDGDEKLVYLTDWLSFSDLFIDSGKHRYMP